MAHIAGGTTKKFNVIFHWKYLSHFEYRWPYAKASALEIGKSWFFFLLYHWWQCYYGSNGIISLMTMLLNHDAAWKWHLIYSFEHKKIKENYISSPDKSENRQCFKMLENLASTKHYKIQETLYLIIDYICRYAWHSVNKWEGNEWKLFSSWN